MRPGPDQRPRGPFIRARRPPHQQPRQPQHNQTQASHGPGEIVRGNTFQIYQRYLALAQEAARSNDRIAAENYYQHAEHYLRVNNENRARNPAAMSHQIDRDIGYPDFEGKISIGQAQPPTADDQPWPTPDPSPG